MVRCLSGLEDDEHHCLIETSNRHALCSIPKTSSSKHKINSRRRSKKQEHFSVHGSNIAQDQGKDQVDENVNDGEYTRKKKTRIREGEARRKRG